MKFEIEQIVTIKSRGQTYIIARQLIPSDWVLSENAHLGGVPIHKWTDIPRGENVLGEQRMDVFSFVLRESQTASHISVGQVVELEP